MTARRRTQSEPDPVLPGLMDMDHRDRLRCVRLPTTIEYLAIDDQHILVELQEPIQNMSLSTDSGSCDDDTPMNTPTSTESEAEENGESTRKEIQTLGSAEAQCEHGASASHSNDIKSKLLVDNGGATILTGCPGENEEDPTASEVETASIDSYLDDPDTGKLVARINSMLNLESHSPEDHS